MKKDKSITNDELVKTTGRRPGVPRTKRGFKPPHGGMGWVGLDHPQADRPLRVGGQQQFRRNDPIIGAVGRVHRQGPARDACLGRRRRHQQKAFLNSPAWRDHHLGRL